MIWYTYRWKKTKPAHRTVWQSYAFWVMIQSIFSSFAGSHFTNDCIQLKYSKARYFSCLVMSGRGHNIFLFHHFYTNPNNTQFDRPKMTVKHSSKKYFVIWKISDRKSVENQFSNSYNTSLHACTVSYTTINIFCVNKHNEIRAAYIHIGCVSVCMCDKRKNRKRGTSLNVVHFVWYFHPRHHYLNARRFLIGRKLSVVPLFHIYIRTHTHAHKRHYSFTAVWYKFQVCYRNWICVSSSEIFDTVVVVVVDDFFSFHFVIVVAVLASFHSCHC